MSASSIAGPPGRAHTRRCRGAILAKLSVATNCASVVAAALLATGCGRTGLAQSAGGGSSAGSAGGGHDGGAADGGGSCTPGAPTSCYAGPPGTEGVGICGPGVAICREDGRGYGPCDGQQLPAPEDWSTGDDESCDGVGDCSESGPWSDRFGHAGYQYGEGVAADASGSMVVVGAYGGTIDLGGGGLPEATDHHRSYAAKFDGKGGHLWSRSLGRGWLHAATTRPTGEVLLAGYFRSALELDPASLEAGGPYEDDAFVAELDALGQPRWSRQIGGSGWQQAEAVELDPTGAVIVAGSFETSLALGSFGFSAGVGGDVFVAKLDSAGVPMWVRTFGELDDAAERPLLLGGIGADATGAVVIAVAFWEQVDLGGGPLVGTGIENVAIAKLSSAGDHVWSRAFGPLSPDQLSLGNLAVGPDGAVYATGSFGGDVDFGGGVLENANPYFADVFVLKLSQQGDHVWSARYGDGDHQWGKDILVDASGELVVGGQFRGSIDFGGGPLVNEGPDFSADDYGLFLARVASADGAHLSSRYFGYGEEWGPRLALDPCGRVFMAGTFRGPLDFGQGALTAAGELDAYTAALSP